MGKKDFEILKIYNDEELLKLKNKHIANLNKNLKTVPKLYKKKLVIISNKNPQPNKKRIGFISYYNRKKHQLLITKKNTKRNKRIN